MPVTLKVLRKKGFDVDPKTLGEHIKKRRLEFGLPQREVGERLNVSVNTVLNWETGKTEPLIEFMPAIIRFLGYDPFPEPTTLSERMLAKRRVMGWSIKDASRRFGVDDGTWGEWEETGVIAWKRYRELETFLDA